MYYQTLLTLEKKYNKKLIEEYDLWLYNLPRRVSDRISIAKASNELKIEFPIAKSILEDSVSLGILERRYAIKCPNCDHVIEMVSIEELYDKIKSINNCDACENENIIITDEDIQILYKKTDNQINIGDTAKLNLKKNINCSNTDSLRAFFEDNILNPNDFFYNPTEEQKIEMIELFEKIGQKEKNTTALGNQLRNFTEYVLRIVKVFEAANIRTQTNEIDCLVKNKLKLGIPYFLNELGSIIIVECKNEKNNPGNTYFHKIQGILKISRLKCGIVVAINEPTKPSLQIANANYLLDRTVIIAIDYEELKKVVYEDLNFLDLLENKVVMLKTNATTYLGDNKVFEN